MKPDMERAVTDGVTQVSQSPARRTQFFPAAFAA